MADNIVGGLFGVDPAQLQQQRMAQDLKEGFMLAQLSPMDRATAGIYAGSKQLGRAGQSLLGMEDPQLQEAAMAKKLSENFDVNSVSGLRGLAIELQKAGSLRYSQLAAQQANDLEKQGLGLQKTQADIKRTEGLIAKEEFNAAQEEKLRAELVALGPNATEQDVINTVTKYGSPDKILGILQRSEDAKLRRAEIAAAKGTAPAKPLATSLQKSEDKDLEAIDTYTAQADALKPSILNLTPDAKGVRKLELGPVNNAKYIAQNAMNRSTPESRAYEALKSAVDTAVNLQVSAEKGVQTDRDVKRFADALIAAYGKNDTEATLQALKRYNEAVEKAKSKTEARVDQRRVSQKVEPLFGGQQRPSTVQPEKPTTAKTRTLKSGVTVTIED
jgi:hypothetical protein